MSQTPLGEAKSNVGFESELAVWKFFPQLRSPHQTSRLIAVLFRISPSQYLHHPIGTC
ncbi:MAG: hypothetical protein PUP93_10175 [Rhizonema sp. NSF051]|nr:hypothetical protein [Rhizonema sp. NSF051]